jgi:hypothetical protein
VGFEELRCFVCSFPPPRFFMQRGIPGHGLGSMNGYSIWAGSGIDENIGNSGNFPLGSFDSLRSLFIPRQIGTLTKKLNSLDSQHDADITQLRIAM